MNTSSDLYFIQTMVFGPCGLQYSELMMEAESAAYSACAFRLNGLSVRFRTSKITPTKTGQFVTLWKRNGKGPIQPFDLADRIDLFIVSAGTNNNSGQFIFPKSALLKHGVISAQGKGGKRALRVYPPWDKPTSRVAQKTQSWQLKYFLDTSSPAAIDLMRAKSLYFAVQ